MQFNQTTCAACGADCTDHLTVRRDGPGLGPVVAVCEACLPVGGELANVWRAIAKRLPAAPEPNDPTAGKGAAISERETP